MNIEIVNAKVEQFANLGRYFFAELRCGKQHMSVVVGSGRVQACVHNASNRVWKGLGKSFESFDKARANYKSAEVLAMINEAERLDRVTKTGFSVEMAIAHGITEAV